jgi:hypothetical protein
MTSDKGSFADTDTTSATTETPTAAHSLAEANPPPTPSVDGTANSHAKDNTEPGTTPRAKTKADADAKPKAKAKAKAKKKKLAPRPSKSGTAGERPKPSSRFADQLRARFAMPNLTLDRRLLPDHLLTALDAAGLGGREFMPAATFMALSMITAVAGPKVTSAPYGDQLRAKLGDALGLGLRVCAIAKHRGGSFVPPAIVAAAVAVQNDLVDHHRSAVDRAKDQRRAAALRRAAHAESVGLAAKLGHPVPPPLTESPITGPGAAPRIVVDDGAASAVTKAAAGGTGIILIDERRMPSIAAVGDGDPATACLLNRFARGLETPVTDNESGRTAMVLLPMAVWGALTEAECGGLRRATSAELLGTVFVRGAPAPAGGDSRPLVELAQRVRALIEAPVELRFSANALTILTTAAELWAKCGGAPPLSEHTCQLADLVRRLAASIQIVTAAGGSGSLGAEISAASVKRAVGLINGIVTPIAQAVLQPVSFASETEADAAAMTSFLRRHTSLQSPKIEKRQWYRGCAIPVGRFEPAVALLQSLKFVVSAEKGEWFAATAAVHE